MMFPLNKGGKGVVLKGKGKRVKLSFPPTGDQDWYLDSGNDSKVQSIFMGGQPN